MINNRFRSGRLKRDKLVINPGWPSYANKTFSPAVVKNGLIFVSGLAADDERGIAMSDTILGQTEIIYKKLDAVLRAAGATFQDVVKTVDYIVDSTDYRKTADIRARYLGPDFPAATGVVVKRLLGKGLLIEIDAIAVVSRRRVRN
jgi:2-iminobutanoate/2-iminopropanoate deaminase